ncbi:MAG: response regulator [Lachnospiraceae bacterium]|nr:response regulator [Lachnospiraceae bacterium]
MQTVLIVEDEKLIRQGIRVMIQRSGVPVENIIECGNGLMAMEVLKNQKVDVMFTDIRMPKMDGIELVKKMQSLPHPPLTVAVSGYDDFSYAVEMMRGGVREYLLKPVDRDSLRKILEKLEQEIAETHAEEESRLLIDCNQLRQVMESPEISSSEIRQMEEQIGYRLFPSYEVCCFAKAGGLDNENNTAFLSLGEMSGHSVCIVERENRPFLLKNELYDAFVGVSSVHSGITGLRVAYLEALQARKTAFCRCMHEFCLDMDPPGKEGTCKAGCIRENEDTVKSEDSKAKEASASDGGAGTADIVENRSESSQEKMPTDDEIKRLAQMLGTDRYGDCCYQMDRFFRKVKRGTFSPSQMEYFLDVLLGLIQTVYGGVLQDQAEEMERLRGIYGFQSVDEYAGALSAFLERIHARTDSRLDEHRNQQKLEQALRYIRENFSRDLNMAVVSNHVSMNYSVFSQEFKQYTGKNFVAFLKELRMEEAKRLLVETDLRVIEISQRVGYENEKHFMKTFKAEYGVSPSVYRKNMGFMNTSPQG